MLGLQRIEVAGERFVLLPEREYERLCSRASEIVPVTDEDLPPFPKPDKHGNFPAVAYARVSIARNIIQARRAAGLSQEELARRAGVRQETISRIESGKHSPTIRTVDKIDLALQRAAKAARKAGKTLGR